MDIINRLLNLLVDEAVDRAGLQDAPPEQGETEGLIGLHLVGWQFTQAKKIIPPRVWRRIREFALPDGVLIHIPGVKSQVRNAPGFEDLFKPMPGSKAGGGYLEVGEYDQMSESFPWEGYVDLFLGPDGNVWAKVGPLDNIPEVTDEE